MINIEIIDRFADRIKPQAIQNVARIALMRQKITDEVDLSIIIDNEEQLKKLNHQFLGNDSSTDVLSFPADEIDPETGRRYLGDIIISFTHADRQSREAGHSTIKEIQLLVVHGILHLLGYDHADEKGKQQMWAAQDEILNSLSDGQS